MESRFVKTKRNLIWQLLYQSIYLALGIVLPRLIIKTYGSEVNGLTSTVKQVVVLVTLLKAGISTAVTYSLYKPVNEKDKQAIAATLDSLNRIFTKVFLLIISIGLGVSVLFTFAQSSSLPKAYVFIACYLLCIHTAIDLKFTAAFNVFFSATQDKYVISAGLLIAGVIMYGLQFFIAIFEAPFVLLYGCCLVGCVVKVLFFNVVFRKKYEQYKPDGPVSQQYSTIKKRGIGYATLNEVAHCAVTATQTVILSIFYGLSEASVYGVYLLVIDALCLIGQVFYISFSPSYCSMIAEGNIETINRIFNVFQYLFFALNTFLYMCAGFLLMPFVRVYTAGATDIDYVNYPLMIGFLLYGVFYAFRIPYNITVSGIGAFKQSGIQTGIGALVSLIITVVLVQFNYAYVIYGPVLFYIANTFYQHFLLKKELHGFDNRRFLNHFLVATICISSMTILGLTIEKVYLPHSFYSWLVEAIIVAAISVILFLLVSFVFDNKLLRYSIRYMSSKIIRKKETK